MRNHSGYRRRARRSWPGGRCSPPGRRRNRGSRRRSAPRRPGRGEDDAPAIPRRQVHHLLRVLDGVAAAPGVADHDADCDSVGPHRRARLRGTSDWPRRARWPGDDHVGGERGCDSRLRRTEGLRAVGRHAITRPRHDDAPGDQQVEQAERQHRLPAERHELVVARPWERAAHDDEQRDEDEGLEEEPHDAGQPRPEQPPKNRVTMSAEMSVTATYSPTRKMPTSCLSIRVVAGD